MRKRTHQEDDSVWAPLSDAMTLAACAFVVVLVASLVAYRSSEEQRQQVLQDRAQELKDLQVSQGRAEQALGTLAGVSGVSKTPNGGVRLPESMLFPSAGADLTAPGEQWVEASLVPVLGTVLEDPTQCVLIAGHTDNIGIHTKDFPSNWELSTRRATTVLRAVLERIPGARPGAIYAAGFADTQLLAGIPGDDGANRRVELYVQRCFGTSLGGGT